MARPRMAVLVPKDYPKNQRDGPCLSNTGTRPTPKGASSAPDDQRLAVAALEAHDVGAVRGRAGHGKGARLATRPARIVRDGRRAAGARSHRVAIVALAKLAARHRGLDELHRGRGAVGVGHGPGG